MIINPHRYGKKLSVAPSHWWDLDDDGTWADSVGSWHGTESGTVGVSSGTGPGGQDVAAMLADADYIRVGSRNPTTEGYGNYSISAWAKFGYLNTGNYGNWFVGWKNSSSTVFLFDVGFYGQALDDMAHRGTDKITDLSGLTISTDTWYHVVATWDGSDTELFVNGVSKATHANSAAPPNSSITMVLGASGEYVAPNGKFYGSMGMVGLWDKAVGQDDIDFLYNGGAGRQFAEL